MENKIKKEELYKMNPVKVYNLVLEGKHVKRFPNGFWEQPEALNNATVITKWLIEEKLKLTNEELKEKLSVNLFKENNLYGTLQHCFNGSPYGVINSAYPIILCNNKRVIIVKKRSNDLFLFS